MRLDSEAALLRIFVGEDDRYRGKPVVEAIVSKALEIRMSGATVLRGHDGFGRSRSIRTELNNIDARPRLPMVIEIVDTREKIDEFLLIVDRMIESGLVTLKRVRALRYLSPRSTLSVSQTRTPSAA
jgi:PII-like signaling protein